MSTRTLLSASAGADSKCRTVDVCDIFGDNSGKALYRLDGNANDESGNYHGAETAITYGGGVYERGAVFNGTSGYLTSALSLTTTSVTISLWVKPLVVSTPSATTGRYILDMETGSRIVISNGVFGSNANIFINVTGTWIDTGVTLSTSIYKHVCVVISGTTTKCYVDSVLVSTTTTTAITSVINMRLGGGVGGGNWFGGSEDQVRIFNRAITATEVSTLYAECAPTSIVDNINPFEDGSLKALYQFNGDATDKTGVYNGTATNVTYATGKFGQCAVFNGSALVSTSFALSANIFSYSGWFKVTTPSSTIQSLIDFTTNRAMLSSGNGTNAYVSYYDGGTYRTFSAYTLPANTFIFLSLVVNGTTAYLYADGILKGTSTCTAIIPSGGMYLGRYAGSAIGFLTGIQDQVRIFNKALTPMEVASLYNETTPLEEPMHSLVDPFKDGSGKALYRLDGNALDESGNYDGTATSVTYGAGRFGRAFVGVGNTLNYITLPSIINTQVTSGTAFSTSFFAKLSADNGVQYATIVSYGQANNLEIMIETATRKITVVIYNVTTSTLSHDTSMIIGQWYHFVWVYNNGVSSLHMDGISASTTLTKTKVNDSQIAYVGKKFNNTFPLNGSIDQVRIFNRALTASEVTALYTEI